jgi:guanine deaminase
MHSSKNSAIAPKVAIRGPVLTFSGGPFKESLKDVMVYESDAIVAFGDGVVTHFDTASMVERLLPPGLPITNDGPDTLISPGSINSHVHLPC